MGFLGLINSTSIYWVPAIWKVPEQNREADSALLSAVVYDLEEETFVNRSPEFSRQFLWEHTGKTSLDYGGQW